MQTISIDSLRNGHHSDTHEAWYWRQETRAIAIKIEFSRYLKFLQLSFPVSGPCFMGIKMMPVLQAIYRYGLETGNESYGNFQNRLNSIVIAIALSS
jgi:hypothetical protein